MTNIDPLYSQAVGIVVTTRRASISNLQRLLDIGYNRAATLMESMEAAGVVSHQKPDGKRDVLAEEVTWLTA